MTYETFIEIPTIGEVQFLAKAVSNEETRYWLNHIHIEVSEKKEGAFLGVATDSKRMHIVDPLSFSNYPGLTPGAWRCLEGRKARNASC